MKTLWTPHRRGELGASMLLALSLLLATNRAVAGPWPASESEASKRYPLPWGPRAVLQLPCGGGPLEGQLYSPPPTKDLLNKTLGVLVKANCAPPEVILWVESAGPVWVNPYASVHGLAADVRFGSAPAEFKKELLEVLDAALTQTDRYPDEFLGPPPLGCISGPYVRSGDEDRDGRHIAIGTQNSCEPFEDPYPQPSLEDADADAAPAPKKP
ncbi:envelope glycoprotein L [Equid alphaherpesvirus 3]|uniref:Envelope glycoprotein L n=1 Tax=Equid alphaherpesvirus 3 TaxID=80341 RepID=A0A077B7N2_9ALPH|nr:envelope glycoprotein L [Equid alphaherpesvirus 3]AIL02979.1 envelope glycoprotein L [Equid alphaherpesvirus 3]